MQRGIKSSQRSTSQSNTSDNLSNQAGAPPSAMNALMGKLGLAREADEPAADEAELARNLTDPAWAVRIATVQKLGSMGKQAPLELLLVALRDEQSSVRIAAARALSRNPRQAALPALLAALTDNEWVVRTETVRALGKLSTPEVLEGLLTAAHDSDATVRSAALTALGEIGTNEAITQLHAAQQDEDWSVREAATLALGQLSEQEAIPALLNARLDQDSTVRATAEASLHQLYPAIAAAPPPPSDSFAQWLERIQQSEEETRIYAEAQPGAPNPPQEASFASIPSLRQPEARGERARGSLPGKKRHIASQKAKPDGWGRKAMHLAEVLVAVLLLVGLATAWLILANRPDIAPVKQSSPSAFTIYRGHDNSVEKLAWSPDGLTMASADSRGMLRVWQVSSGHTIIDYSQQGKVLALDWSDANTLLVAYSIPNQSLQVQVFSMETARVRTIFQQFNLPGTSQVAAWSPHSSILAFDAGNGSIQLWTMNETDHEYLLTIPGQHIQDSQLAWSPDGSQIATISAQGLLQTWDASTGTLVAHLASGGPITSADWIACGQFGRGLVFANSQGAIIQWCPAQEKPRIFFSARSYNLKNSSKLSAGVIALSPNGKQILLATSDGLVQARDVMSGNLIDVYAGHSAQVNAIAWSPDGRSIATASLDSTVQVWQEA